MNKHICKCMPLTLIVMIAGNPLLALASSRKPEITHTSARPRTNRTLATSKLKAQEGAVAGQSSTLLPDGRWLKLGGTGADGALASGYVLEQNTGVSSTITGLHFARAWHTATLLPNGKVLILGGVGADGSVVESPELFDLDSNLSEVLPSTGLTPRTNHSATVLTDGLVLIAGGLSAGGRTLRTAEFWDFRSGKAWVLASVLRTARSDQAATLLPDGNVLFWGGSDRRGNPLPGGEIFDVRAGRFGSAGNTPMGGFRQEAQPPLLEASIPADRESGVATDTMVSMRFSKPLRVNTVKAETVTFTGPEGAVSLKIVPAEGGMLAFLAPAQTLLPGATYSVAVMAGLVDTTGLPLGPIAFSFTTRESGERPASTEDEDDWSPGPANYQGNWRTGRLDTGIPKLAPLMAADGVTAVSGQTLTLKGAPLAHVTLAIGDKSTRTDETGRFLLADIAASHRVLKIDGRTASRPGRTFGVYQAGIEVKDAQTNVLPFTIWMAKLDAAHAVRIPSPTRKETVITTPRIPGLEVRLPAGAVVTDIDGKTANQVSITAIPVDRPPFPLPPGVFVPVLFTVQPGAATINPPAVRIIYPNYTKAPPGARFDFWNYEPDDKGWFVYGHGTVSSDGSQIIPDPGVLFYEFNGVMVSSLGGAQKGEDPCNGCNKDGDPVDLGTGLFVYKQTDLFLPDVIPISLTRMYRQSDPSSRAFGIGASHTYEMYLSGNRNPYTYVDLYMGDGAHLHYDRISSGTDVFSAVYQHTSTPSAFFMSTISWNGGGWTLKLKDGTVLKFPDGASATRPQQAALISISDRNGNTVTLNRDSSGNLVSAVSPNGRAIYFTYDASLRITQAKDNIARTVNYSYDSAGRLSQATDANGGVTQYAYDSSNNMTTVTDPRNILYSTNQYDANGRMVRQTMANGGVYQFAYTLDGSGNVTETDVTDPNGNLRKVTFNSAGYMLSDTRPCCSGQSITYQRQAGTNLVLSATDSLGRTTAYSYDGMGNVAAVTRLSGTPRAVTTAMTYDAAYNQITSATDPLGHTTSFGYDNKGNPTTITDPLNDQGTVTYNTAGQVTAASDPMGNTWQFGYDGADVTSITDPLGQKTRRFVDGAGRILSVTNPLGQVMQFSYDPLNRLTAVTDTLGGVTASAYDGNSNLLSITDARSHSVSYSYNTLDLPGTRTDPLQHSETYQYDLAGNLAQMTDRKNQTTTYQYDGSNRLTQVTFADQSSVSYGYDAGNRVAQISDSISGSVTYIYDGLDRILSKTTPQGVVSYTYDNADRRASMTVQGQPTINYAYDNADRVTQVTQGASTVSITYDNAGRRASLTFPNGVVAQYSYDRISQITALSYAKGGTSLGNLTYSYDPIGRRTSVGGSLAQTALPQAVPGASYNAANQQTSFGAQALTYDLNGNLTGDGANTYTWDARNRLISISGASLAANFQYDWTRRRITKRVNGATTSYLYDQENVTQEQAGGAASANMLSGLAIDDVFSRADGSGTWSILKDALGNTIANTDSTGTVQTTYTYEPFGKATPSGVSSSNPFQFSGRDNDATGLYYFRNRYYSPALARFISEDPLDFGGGDANLYAYVSGSPISYTDPMGLGILVHFDRFGGMYPGPPPQGGRKTGAPGLAGNVMIASAADPTACGKLVALGTLGAMGILAITIAKNPPKSIPVPETVCKPSPEPPKRDCAQEWADARARCTDLLSQQYPPAPRALTGSRRGRPYTNIEDCARGFVSEECGGNPIDWGPQK